MINKSEREYVNPIPTVGMYTVQYIGKRLYMIRHAVNYSTKQMAKAIGSSQPSINHWELGTQLPPIKTLIRICNITGIDIESFLTGDSWLDDLTPDSPGIDMIRERLEESDGR